MNDPAGQRSHVCDNCADDGHADRLGPLSVLLLVPHLAQALFALVRRHFVALAFLTAWHIRLLRPVYY